MKDKMYVMYHDIIINHDHHSGFSNPEAYKYKVNVDDFKSHLEIYRKSTNEIILTFDDGGNSCFKISPLLERFDLKGHFFITTSCIGKPGFLTEFEIIDLHKRGHIIGTHSHTHPKLMKKLSLIELENEWKTSIEKLQNIINDKIEYASIPGGSFSSKMTSTFKKLGIKTVFTSVPTLEINMIDNVTIIGRYTILGNTRLSDIKDLIKSYSIVRIKQAIAWYLMDLLKVVLGPIYLNLRKTISTRSK